MNKLLAATFLVAAAAVAAAQTVWRFEATDGDGKQGGDAVGKSANKTPKTGDTTDCRSARRHAIGFGAVPEQLIGFRICCVLPGELGNCRDKPL